MPKMLGNRAADTAGRTVLVHIHSNAAGKIRREKRDGRETIVVPSFAAKANTVLNDIFYPEAELHNSLDGLNRTPAPLGHPLINGKFVPALDPEALARNHVFAWNENARWVGDRIALDVVVDEARAKESEGGRKVLNAIEKELPISTSTGLVCSLENVGGKEYKAVARNIEWDHVAILLDEAPAISPDEGVGIFVNSKGEQEQIEVSNSALEDAESDLDWAADMAARAIERMERAPLLERIKSAIMEVVSGLDGRETSATQQKEADMADEKQLDQLSAKVNAIEESLNPENLAKSLGETIGNAVSEAVKPLIDAQAEMKANQEAKDKAELDEHVAAIVRANLLDEESAKELTLNAARKLAEKAKPGKAAALNGAFDGKSDDNPWAGYSLNAHVKTGETAQ